LFKILQSENMNIVECLNYVKDFQLFLGKLRQSVAYCDECQKKLLNNQILQASECDTCEIIGFELIWQKTIYE